MNRAHRPDEQNAGVVQLALTVHADIGQANVTSVASNINHDTAKTTVFIKEAASMNVLFKPLFNVHSSRATHASSGDGLLVASIYDIASGEHTWN